MQTTFQETLLNLYSRTMKMGKYNLQAVIAGRFRLDGGAMFGVVPKVMWSKEHPADDLNRIELVCRSLLIEGEGRVILVNTGIGQNRTAKERAIYAIDSTVDLHHSLMDLGYDPQDVTDVIQTHLHIDHVGGSTKIEGRVRRPAFTNAFYYTQKQQYEWACNNSERDRASFRPEDWECLVDDGSGGGPMRLIEGEQQLFPGIYLHLVHGHTPFQQLPRISDGQRSLIFCSDLIPLASQVQLPWVMGYDLHAVNTVAEKKSLLSQAADQQWILFLEHDPKYELCKVVSSAEGFSVSESLDLRSEGISQ